MRVFRQVVKCLLLAPLIGSAITLVAVAQPVPGATTTDWTGAAGNQWTNPGNWTAGVPDVNLQDFGVINNAGTAIINSAVGTQAGGLSLGTAGSESGTLEIQNGGSLTVVDDTFGFLSDGSVRVGQGGTGTLRVQPGGSLNSVSLSLGGASAASSIVLGGTTAGTTTVVTNTATLGRTTRVTGPNVNFSALNGLTLSSTSKLVAGITAANHSPLKTGGVASIAGILRPEFTGFTPAAGNRWNLIDASTINGQFSGIDLSAAPALSTGQVYFVAQRAGGTNGSLLQLGVEQLLTLRVDWDSKAISIKNSGTAPVTLDSYSILSSLGGLNPAAGKWNSLADQAVAGWTEAGPTVNALSELNPSGSLTISGGVTRTLGIPFNPQIPAQSGDSPEDLKFRYSTTSGDTFTGFVEYTGLRDTNNLRLTVDPATGQAQIRNEGAIPISLEGYTIRSAAGNLLAGGWNSLDDQNVGGAIAWQEAGPTSNVLSELNPLASTTIAANAGFPLGALWNTAGTQQLEFVFQLLSEATTRVGSVVFGSLPSLGGPLLGDYNGSNVVDAADYTVWRNTLGQNVPMGSGADGSNDGHIGPEDYALWKSNFGNSQGAGSGASSGVSPQTVPEPQSWALVVMLAALALMGRSAFRATALRPALVVGRTSVARWGNRVCVHAIPLKSDCSDR